MEMPSLTAMVTNSIGKPPAWRMPSLPRFASRSSDMLQGVTSFQLLATPIWGLSQSSSVMPTARSLARDAFCKGVVAIREAIAAGDVYEVNLCRVLSAAVAADADIVGLGGVLRAGNPSPHGAIIRLPGVEVASASPELFLHRDRAVIES